MSSDDGKLQEDRVERLVAEVERLQRALRKARLEAARLRARARLDRMPYRSLFE